MTGAIRISLPALRHNAQTLRELVGPHTATAFVVKSNAYGHGLIETALAIEGFAATLCVYSAQEGIALREGGITIPILVLGPIEFDALDDAIANKLEFALWDTGEFVRRAAAAAQKRHTRAGVHVKINTGLNRLGLEPHDVPDAMEDYVRVSGLEIKGVFSHLAAAEELDSPYTMHQLERFNEAFTRAQPALANAHGHPKRHIAASAAAMLWPQTRLDMVRVGIALYGLWPSEQTKAAMNGNAVDLLPALSYMSKCIVVRTIPAGEPIGYGCTFHAPRTMRVGVVPLGYADGIPRALSNRGAFLVGGVRAPIVGRVAMNLTTIDLSNAPSATVESPVTLLGSDGDSTIAAEDWAQWAETINYEILARLPQSAPRIYLEA